MKRTFNIFLRLISRCISIILVSAVLVLMSPVLLILYFLIYLNLGEPVFYIQVRSGLNGKPFNMIKFRTMIDSVDKDGFQLPDSVRLTKFGSFLRSTSLDELPGLINVLKGDMNIVGPRPLLMEYLPLYSIDQFRRHNVKPGITGWAQVNGRNLISWDEKFAFDVWYVENRSVLLDLKILLMTALKVVQREGVNASNEVTMKKFTGNK